MENLKDLKKYAIVAGNGPSLAEIDYTRLHIPTNLPANCDFSDILEYYDIFRCNQFYFEDKYYLGKNIKLAFAISPNLFEQSYTYKTLNYTNQYNILNIGVSDFNLTCMDSVYHKHLDIFDDIITGSIYLSKLKAFYSFMRYNEIYKNKRITSGIYMCAFATALGYKEIYIAGIDLYKAKEAYAFDTLKPNLLKVLPNFGLKPGDFHTQETDIMSLKFLEDNYDVKFYTLCPNSPIAEYIPLADKANNKAFIPIQKQEDSIRDMLIPESFAYDMLKYYEITINKEKLILKLTQQTPFDDACQTTQKLYREPIEKNMIYRIFKDIVRLPKDIAFYIKGKRLAKRNTEVKSKLLQQNIKNNHGGGG